MLDESKKMKSIWFLVGLMLLAMGAIITVSGVYYLVSPNQVQTTLGHLHPSIWWGAIMVVAGLIFIVAQRNARRD